MWAPVAPGSGRTAVSFLLLLVEVVVVVVAARFELVAAAACWREDFLFVSRIRLLGCTYGFFAAGLESFRGALLIESAFVLVSEDVEAAVVGWVPGCLDLIL